MYTEKSDGLKFIKKHVGEIKPVIEDPVFLDRIIAGEDTTEQEVGEVLREFETKVFVAENKEAQPDAKRVVLEVSEPLGYGTIAPILKRLLLDPRCRSVCVITDNVAAKEIEKNFGDKLTQVHGDHNQPVVADIPGDFDVALFLVEPPNSPNSLILNSGKSVFGATKSYLIVSGWVGMGSSSITEAVQENRDDIDGILCNDDLSKRILESQLPLFDESKIQVVGSPVIDALDRSNAKEWASKGAEKFNISNNELVISYLGDISDYHTIGYDVDEEINEKTFERLLENIKRLSDAYPQQKFCVLVRPHPRDPSQDKLRAIAEKSLAPNVRIVWASRNEAGMQEVAYTSDVVASIVSTENILATLRGKKALYLGYDNKLGEGVLNKLYTQGILDVFRSQPDIGVAKTDEDVLGYLSGCVADKMADKNIDLDFKLSTTPEDSIEVILTRVLS